MRSRAPTHDLAVVIGRFQPFHHGHLALVRRARELGKAVLLVLGSQDASCDVENPWTVNQRVRFMRTVLGNDWTALGQPDSDYNPTAWSAGIQEGVETLFPEARTVVLVGHAKDASSWYLNLFPHWDFEPMDLQAGGLSATRVRHHLYHEAWDEMESMIHPHLLPLLCNWLATPEGRRLQGEYRHLENQARVPQGTRACHLVVASRNRYLVVRRDEAPGMGLYALPGPEMVLPRIGDIPRGLPAEFWETIDLQLGTEALDLIRSLPLEGPWHFSAPRRDPRGITEALVWKVHLGNRTLGLHGPDRSTRWIPRTDSERFRPRVFLDHFRMANHVWAREIPR